MLLHPKAMLVVSIIEKEKTNVGSITVEDILLQAR